MKRAEQIVYAGLVGMIILLVITRMCKMSSSYQLGPGLSESPITMTSKGDDNFQAMSTLPYKLNCVPGPQADASPYTKSLTPGGICGIQEFVNARSNYTITGGIGDSLLS